MLRSLCLNNFRSPIARRPGAPRCSEPLQRYSAELIPSFVMQGPGSFESESLTSSSES